MNTQPKTQLPKKPLKDTLFERIEKEQVCPHSRLFFQSRELAVWLLWLASVVIGSLAVAVSVFMVTHLQYELYEVTHENFFTFLVEVLPYLWIIVFALMVYVAIYNLKHTKYGYRYPVPVILLSSIVMSFAGGSALQFFGFGYVVDRTLGHQVSMYTSIDKLEKRLWQMPEDGRLVGKQVFSTLSPTSTVVFEDTIGQRWRMDVSELQSRDIELLASEKPVRLLGKAEDIKLRLFHACGALPLMNQEEVSVTDILGEREAFIQRIYRHTRQDEDKIIISNSGTFASSSFSKQSVCANIAVARRMPACDMCKL